MATKSRGINNQPLGQLAVRALDEWKNAKQILREHSKKLYHEHCVVDSNHFLSVYSKQKLSIINQLDLERAEQIKSNRKKLISIINCVILCGRQEITLRCHRDSGNSNNQSTNVDNFRAILNYRSEGDDYLKHHLEEQGRNKYITPQVQN
uniref:Uncharacterized protein n=1 Tax=Sipha flava TaxID=143950 RepID=A0A2S2QEI7_9HEMI